MGLDHVSELLKIFHNISVAHKECEETGLRRLTRHCVLDAFPIRFLLNSWFSSSNFLRLSSLFDFIVILIIVDVAQVVS